MKLFKKPRWLKPEIDKLKYWVHLLFIVAIFKAFMFFVPIVLQFFNITLFDFQVINQNFFLYMLSNPWEYLWFVIGLGIADIIAHTVLKLD